jgi:branched-chain amino acid transport system ATP-binding protein
VLVSLKDKDVMPLMSQPGRIHSQGVIDVEFTVERGANV